MTMSSEKVITAYYIAFVVFWFEEGALPTESFQVIRGKYDKFYNPSCSRSHANEESKCSKFCLDRNSVCDTSGHCVYCICQNEERNTYDVDKTKCVEGRDIIPESVEPGINFRIRTRRNEKDFCATPSNYYVKVELCKLNLPGMLWVWTTGSQIKNIEKDYCMEVTRYSKKIKIVPCSTSLIYQPQKFSCEEFWYSFHLKNGNSFLRLSDRGVVVGQKPTYKWNNYTRTDQSVCSTQTKGCYRFADGSFLQLLSNKTCHGEKDCFTKKIAAPISAQNRYCTLEWRKSKFMRNDGSWKLVNGENFFSIELTIDNWTRDTTGKIKIVNYTNAFQVWSGSLLRLEVTCEAGSWSKEEHCVLLKFETLQEHIKAPNISQTFPKRPRNQPSTLLPTSISLSTTSITSSPTRISSSPTRISSSSTSIPSYSITRPSHRTSSDLPDLPTISPKRVPTSGSRSLKTVMIAVSIVISVAILLIIFGALMFYKRRKRSQDERNIYEDPSPVYEELNLDQRDIGTEKDYQGLIRTQRANSRDITNSIYDYIDKDDEKMKDPGSNESEHRYTNKNKAHIIAVPRQSAAPGAPIYHTLEEPEATVNPTSTHDGSSVPLHQQAKNPTYGTPKEPKVENGSATGVKPEGDYSEVPDVPPGDDDPYYHVLDI